MRTWLFALWLACESLAAGPQQVDAHRWKDVDRIVAIGDLHGDWNSYFAVLRAAGVVDRRGRWAAGETHLVQTGDIPDRGPDTRRIIEHLARLTAQAQRRGGRVHALIGNHEAMNVYGDLRYAVPGEFAAFADARSGQRRERYRQAVLQELERADPARFAALPPDFRARWEAAHPLGWVEHRLAWDPRWDAHGEMYRWVMQAAVAVQLDALVFLHAGLSHAYCGNSLASLTGRVHAALQRGDPGERGILVDPLGPLWYRGLAGIAPAARSETVAAILARHQARHIVIGHSTTGGVIWPRLDARVIQIDTGMSAVYGARIGWLLVEGGKLSAGYPGGRVPLPLEDAGRLAYLDAVIALQPDNEDLRERRAGLLSGALEAAQAQADAASAAGVICDTSG